MTLAAELEAIAIAVAREGGDLARRRRGEGVAIAATKSALADIVTEADREVEALIRERIAVARPDDGFLGEEGGSHVGTSGITWVVDPIDGTVNYAFGIPAYATSVAAVAGTPEPGRWDVLAGVVYSPAHGELFHAAAGHGAWLDGRRLAVNPAPGEAGALLATGFGYDAATHATDLALVGRIMPLARDIRRIGAAALDIAYVAAGRVDGFFERGLKPWDHAAADLLVTEAGGQVAWVDDDARPLSLAAGPDLFGALEQATTDRG
ncbi:inositol monophosphatase family protein [Microbacterium xanthum]|uniref:inositol monophosphatase family protein n=1 Tax=Microbacterium xanthum TaxID=3079794 RepID=UPI002AD4FA0F|nr:MULTISPECIES: inositol monophosphatase family protein [unclassified Microbacterium]MDZ8171782.1 inositol monophosphatase family protein [Microbacterium sp. KSW-48]MDZ8200115.1 inositol monophosphatase family protein [Microbacterium sp. SSW1-59]